MADIREVTNNFAVAPQIDEDDFAQIAAAGFKLVVCNRPDDETFGQMASATARTLAEDQGLGFVHIPFKGAPGPGEIDAMAKVLQDHPEPTFAYCRSGTRSTVVWAMASVKSGYETVDSAIAKAHKAGYDLSQMQGALSSLAPQT